MGEPACYDLDIRTKKRRPIKRRRNVRPSKRMLLAVSSALAVLAAFVAVIGLVTQPTFGREQRITPAVSPDASRLERHVLALVEDFFPRDHSHPEQLERAASYIEAELRGTGARISNQPIEVNAPAGFLYRNVIASFGPATGPRIIVGAHYDAMGELPGADDNASGIAVLLELARLLGAGPEPAMQTELVAYVLEEPPYFRDPFMGSAVHAAFLRADGAAVRAMLCLEMVGYFSDEPGSQRLPTVLLRPFYPDRGDFSGIIGDLGSRSLVRKVKRSFRAASSLPTRSLNGPRFIPGVEFSDHLSYWNEGYPAIMITDTAFYRNIAYHTEGDTPDRLDYEKMVGVVLGVYQAVRSLK